MLKGKADDAAHEALRKLVAAHPKMGINKLCEAMRAAGHGRGAKWVTVARGKLSGGGVTLSE